jgi:tripartite-type tricarboxylate transporter receptor subunit TctC
MKLSRRSISTALAFGWAAPFLPAQAQETFPARSVRLIVPFPPGGSTDVLARLLGQKLTERWGQTVLIDNRAGGNTVIGAQGAATAPADGYTLFMPIDFTLTMNQALYSKLPYDPRKDFTPITLLTEQSLLISIHPKLPVRSLKEFIAYAKANPGKISYGTGAFISQVAGEILKRETGIDMVNVSFRGSIPTLQALAAGDVQMTISDLLPYFPYLKDGRVIGLATTGKTRAAPPLQRLNPWPTTPRPAPPASARPLIPGTPTSTCSTATTRPPPTPAPPTSPATPPCPN